MIGITLAIRNQASGCRSLSLVAWSLSSRLLDRKIDMQFENNLGSQSIIVSKQCREVCLESDRDYPCTAAVFAVAAKTPA